MAGQIEHPFLSGFDGEAVVKRETVVGGQLGFSTFVYWKRKYSWRGACKVVFKIPAPLGTNLVPFLGMDSLTGPFLRGLIGAGKKTGHAKKKFSGGPKPRGTAKKIG